MPDCQLTQLRAEGDFAVSETRLLFIFQEKTVDIE